MKAHDIAVIFDMDGVIFDSEQAYIDIYRELLTRDGITFIEQACIDAIGANWLRTREIWREYYGDAFDFEPYHTEARAILTKKRFPLKPYVHEIFDDLTGRKVPIALASSTREESVMRMLSEADLVKYFDAIICGDMVSHSKPHPEIFLTAAQRLGVQPENCYVIEDSYNGIRCAHNAGMHPIMVPDILQPDDEIRGLAEVVLPNLREAIPYLEKVMR